MEPDGAVVFPASERPECALHTLIIPVITC
jgi:hypothetical protein